MSQFIECVESRVLFSVTLPSSVVQGAAQVDSDLVTLRADYKTLLTDSNAANKGVAVQLKTQKKSLVSTVAWIKLEKTLAVERSKTAVALAKYIAAVKIDVLKLRSDDLLELKKPTAANETRLSNAITALQFTSGPQYTFYTTMAEGVVEDDAALGSVIAANPSDTALQPDTFESAASPADGYIVNDDNKINDDINTLVTAVAG